MNQALAKILNEQLDLEKELALYKALPMGDGQEKYGEKMAFARWLSTPEAKRNPRTTHEAAVILGCTPQTLDLWRRSPEIAAFKRRDAEALLENAFSLVVYKTLVGVDRLNPQFFKIYNDMLSKIANGKDNSKFPKLPNNLIDMATKRNEDTGRDKMQGALNDIEKTTVFTMAGKGEFEVAQ